MYGLLLYVNEFTNKRFVLNGVFKLILIKVVVIAVVKV